MCGRFNLRATPVELQQFFDLMREPDPFPIRFNIAPTSTVIGIRKTKEGRQAIPHKWGLITLWSDPKQSISMFNARAETVRDKPAFRTAYRKRRCVVPASGFYEWKKLTPKTKEPWHIFRQDGEPLIFAGLYEQCDRPDMGHVDSCTIITTEPNEFMDPLHNRMPVILSREDADLWLNPDIPADELFPLLQPCPTEWITGYPTNPIVGNTRNETPDCIAPVKAGLF